MSANLRVHIAPVGYQFLRVTEPLVKMQADKVYLVSFGKDDSASKFFAQVKKELSQKYKHIKVEEVFLDIWNLYECIGKFREIILKEKGNHVYVNVSTGTKITAIAGMLACMLWNATPYYASVSYPKTKESEVLQTEHVQDPDVLPVYGINKPKREYMLILNLLKENGGQMRKARLISGLEDAGIIRIRDESKSELTHAAKHSQLRAILHPMESEWKYVRVEASGRRSEVFITPQGEAALRIFGVSDTRQVEKEALFN
jgi:CRISPR locus-related DNA-binding protein